MAVNRRYYWLQLKEDFFKSKEMKLMRKLPGGEELTIIYLKIMLASLPDEGKIYFEGLAEDLAEELALLIDEDTEAVRMALMFLSKKNLLTTNDNYQFTLEQVPEMIGSETASTRRSRKHREGQKALQCNTDATKRNGDIEIDIDLDLDQEQKNAVGGENLIFKKLKEAFGEMSVNGTMVEEVERLLKQYGQELVVLALNETILNAGKSLRYTMSILQRWDGQGLRTAGQIKAADEEYERKKFNKTQVDSYGGIPSWSNLRPENQKEPESEMSDEEYEIRLKEFLASE
ncbi:phage replisome organizer N-terminal domain-containing protein [Streptococcus sp. A12]|uniref:phage replisome organizer N-terminal domain-containing protein n=1 Tax=Streptococcus sp. A12 TaxID=1759399 RepID=UPI0025D986C7|nr:phage replisome organizer N-terminal domain-containing protein [Streptococcus sp. A12]